MGLDMYLFKCGKVDGLDAETYHKLYYKVMDIDAKIFNNNPENIPLDIFQNDPPLTPEIIKSIKYKDIGYFSLMEQVGYWRKTNHIHHWFVENVQEGVDNCNSFYVSKEKLINLLKNCQIVLENFLKAPEILPTREGLFFGSTEYDFYYLQDVKDTAELLTNVLKTTNFDSEGILYYADW
jgi:hypothetical protein